MTSISASSAGKSNASISTGASTGSRKHRLIHNCNLKDLATAELNRQRHLHNTSARQRAKVPVQRQQDTGPRPKSEPQAGSFRVASKSAAAELTGSTTEPTKPDVPAPASAPFFTQPKHPSPSPTTSPTTSPSSSATPAAAAAAAATAPSREPRALASTIPPQDDNDLQVQPQHQHQQRQQAHSSTTLNTTSSSSSTLRPRISPPDLASAPTQPPPIDDIEAGLFYHHSRLVTMAAARRVMGAKAWREDNRDLPAWEKWHVDMIIALEDKALKLG